MIGTRWHGDLSDVRQVFHTDDAVVANEDVAVVGECAMQQVSGGPCIPGAGLGAATVEGRVSEPAVRARRGQGRTSPIDLDTSVEKPPEAKKLQ